MPSSTTAASRAVTTATTSVTAGVTDGERPPGSAAVAEGGPPGKAAAARFAQAAEYAGQALKADPHDDDMALLLCKAAQNFKQARAGTDGL